MSAAFVNAQRDHGQAIITHIALFNATVEISGGSPAYARKAVTWVDTSTGVSSPSADLVFNIPSGATVAAWRGFSALTGGTDYGGATFAVASGPYGSQGTFTLLAASTSVQNTAV